MVAFALLWSNGLQPILTATNWSDHQRRELLVLRRVL